MSTLGLKRGTVKVVPYNEKWVREFEKEKNRIMKVCEGKIVSLEHIGSTSVPHLAAKPIIDISIGIKRFKDAEGLIKPLASIGYHFYKQFQHQMLFCKGPDKKRTHYLHIMRYKGAKWQSDISFREHLRTHPKEVGRYAKLKENLAKKYPNDRQKYSDGKNVFITSIVKNLH